jgi:hypothetical protein
MENLDNKLKATTSRSGQVTTKKVETLGAIAARQMIVNESLQLLIDEHGEDKSAISHTKHYAFGSYLIFVEVI